MTVLSLIIALLLERSLPQLKSFRRFDGLRDYSRWMLEVLQIDKLGPWGALAVLMAPLLLAVWLLSSMFHNALFGLFELAFGVIVIYLSLGPDELDPQVDDYLDTLDDDDPQARRSAAMPLLGQDAPEALPEQAEGMCRALFSEALIRIYGPVFWFVVLGPVGAVAYRILERFQRQADLLDESLQSLRAVARELLGWMDWIPARITAFAYMIAGRFDDGWQAFRRGVSLAADLHEQNTELLRQVGAAAIGLAERITAPESAAAELRKARGLVLRALVIWLLLVLALTLLF